MRRSFFIIAILVGSFFIYKNILASTWSPPAVAINEVCWMGSASSASDEWFELYNNTDGDIDLTGWKIMVSSTELTYKNFNNIISAHDYYLLERTDDNSAPGALADAIYNGTVSLSNNGDGIKILNSEGQIVDWINLWPWPKGNNDSKQTMERISASVMTSDETNWQDSLLPGGTPGVVNSNLTPVPEKQNPQAIINLSTTSIKFDDEFNFDGSNSIDPDGEIISWLWNFGDGSSSELVNGNYNYSATGTFVISLNVLDNDGLYGAATTSVYVFDDYEIIPTSTPTSTEIICDWNKIKLNEIVSDPEVNNEWVELYNLGDGICNLSGGVVCDNTEENCKMISSTIAAQNFLVFDLGTSRYFNNDIDSVILKNNKNETVDFVNYGSGGLLASDKGQSFARVNSGVDTDSNSDWAITTIVTAGTSNIIKVPTTTSSNTGSSGGSSSASVSTVTVKNCYAGQPIILYELLPDPIGNDETGEYIKIKNISSGTINLKYWKLTDSSKEYDLLGEIKTGEILNFVRASTSIALNNSTSEEVKLIDPCGRIIDKANYSEAKENFVYYQENGKWFWSDLSPAITTSTIPKNQNTDKVKIIWGFDYPENIIVGEKVQFDASKSADPRGGELTFSWDFGNGEKLFGIKQQFVFVTSGINNITVSALSSAGTSDETDFSVLVRSASSSAVGGIFISEIMANPEGSDSNEYIKINNINTTSIDISNWRLVYKNKYFVIPSSTIFAPSTTLAFFKTATKFSLSNSGGVIELWDDKNQIASSFKFGKAKSGAVALAGEENNNSLAAKSSVKKFVHHVVKDVRANAEKGDLVIVRGKVSVLPGIFGSQYFYLADKDSGIQIYKYDKKFPDLKIGDELEIWGEVSQSGEIKRIKVTAAGKIKKLNYNYPILPTVFKVNDLGEAELGRFIKISGEVTQVKSSFVYIDDDSGELKVYFKPGAKIAAKSLVVGEKVEVAGILEDSSGGLQLWPRSPDDVNIIGSVDYNNSINTSTTNQSQGQAEGYLVATGGGITALFLGLLARSRGTILLTSAKKVASLAGKIIRRG